MKGIRTIIAVVLVCAFSTVIAYGQSAGGLKNSERPLSSESAKIIGKNTVYDGYHANAVTIAAKLYDGYFWVQQGREQGNWITFDIRGWDRLCMCLGIRDEDEGKTANVSIELDGNIVLKKSVRHGDQAVYVDIPLTGSNALSFRWDGRPCFANAKLIKGNPTTGLPPNTNTGGVINSQATPASFVVDPNDLDKLATNLRKRVDAKPEIQQKLMGGFLAVMTFDLVDIPSVSVGKNVAEDLSTSLINSDFQLVERGQLDKALKELKIQDSALIDQATALKLGQITGCNYIIVGSVSDRGQFLVINARFLETASGKAVAAERVECRKIEIKR